MKKHLLPPAQYIRTQDALTKLAQHLKTQALIGVDTESNSSHAYQEHVCLIQISTRKQDFIVDPLAIEDMQALDDVFADEAIEKVFHAAEYDIICLKRDFGYAFNNIFDTMMAARLCGLSFYGLQNLLEDYLGIKQDKSHQLDNWKLRPLSKSSLLYAQKDSHYLPQLRDTFINMLRKNGQLEEAYELFEEITLLPPAEVREFDEDGFWKLGRPNHLTRRQMRILRELYALRDQIARQRDNPPLKVFSNKLLIRLSRRSPKNMLELKRVPGFSARQVRRFGTHVLKAIRRGNRNKHLPSPPPLRRPDPVVSDRYIALHNWRKERAIARGVESDIIISKQALWDLAYRAPLNREEMRTINGIGPWKLDHYGDEILELLDGMRELER
jgi:ribonuclease D